MDKGKPKTYMLRLYPDSASDQILINYLKQQRNIQQYIRQLIEDDIENKNIIKAIREVMDEYFQNNGQVLQNHLTVQDENKNDGTSDIKKLNRDEKEEYENFIPGQISDKIADNEDDVEEITPEAFAFLEGLGQ